MNIVIHTVMNVVLHLCCPTSNYNDQTMSKIQEKLYMSLFLHQTTTLVKKENRDEKLYMSLFLHQTTTLTRWPITRRCCICLYSYIKPQRRKARRFGGLGCICLYSYIKPQPEFSCSQLLLVVYVSIPTSNHNPCNINDYFFHVVYVSIPTSNHNLALPSLSRRRLYMSLFLHQTTTCIKVT